MHRLLTLCAGVLLAAASASAQDPITASDLQHHRWVLASIDGEPLPAAEPGKTPELDFGEQSFVSGSLGCNRFSGQARLRDGSFLVENMISTRMSCPSPWSEIELKVQVALAQAATISLDAERRLSLQTADTVLVFEPRDWVR